eukprot:UC4_evm7s1442
MFRIFSGTLISVHICVILSNVHGALELSPPDIVGSSRDAMTHFWFTTNSAIVLNESYIMLDVRLADDCADYYCNKSKTHKPSVPSHEVLLSRDGGRSFMNFYNVKGRSPWDTQTSSAPFIGPCVIDLNESARLVLYQGQIQKPWESPASVFNLDKVSGHIGMGLSEKIVRYHGIEKICNSHMWNQAVLKIPLYEEETSWLLTAQCDNLDHKTSVLIFHSSNSFDWMLRSSINLSHVASGCESPGENTVVPLLENGLLLVARCGSDQTLLGWSSFDGGHTWQRHALPEAMKGVMPVAIKMGNAIILTTGRGGLALWLNPFGDGRNWSLINIGKAHNELILHNDKIDGANLQFTASFAEYMNMTRESTAYNTLFKLDSKRGCVCYDRLSWDNKSSWNGPPGNRAQNDHVFCMQFVIS